MAKKSNQRRGKKPAPVKKLNLAAARKIRGGGLDTSAIKGESQDAKYADSIHIDSF